MSNDRLADSEWIAFMARLETAEHEFAQGRHAAFKALWSHGDEVSLCGGFGGVESGWDKVGARLDWASSKYSDGTRSSEEIRSTVGDDFAYIVQKEVIRFRIAAPGGILSPHERVDPLVRRRIDAFSGQRNLKFRTRRLRFCVSAPLRLLIV